MRARWQIMFWTCAAAVMVLSLLPPAPYMPTTGWDKTNHILGFAVLAFLGGQAYPKRVAMILPALLVYGGLIELLQSFTPDRYAEWEDMIADVIGILAGYGILVLLNRNVRSGPAD